MINIISRSTSKEKTQTTQTTYTTGFANNTSSQTTTFTPCNIWGQLFDGIKDVDGTLTISNGDLNVNGNALLASYVNPKSNIKYTTSQSTNTTDASGETIYTKGKLELNNVDFKAPNISTDKLTPVNYEIEIEGRVKTPAVDTTEIGNSTGNKITVNDSLKINGNVTANTAVVETLEVTKSAHFFELIIDKVKSVGGRMIISPASAKLYSVDTDENGDFRCMFRATDEDNYITNEFQSGDYVVCQTFNLSGANQTISLFAAAQQPTESTSVTTSGPSETTTTTTAPTPEEDVNNRYYWRCIKSVDEDYTDSDGNVYHVITIAGNNSASFYDTKSNAIPQEGDEIVMLGSSINGRGNAIIISAYNDSYLDSEIKAPSFVQYANIDNFNLKSHRQTVIAQNGNIFTGEFKFTSGSNIEDVLNNIQSGNTAYLHVAYSNGNEDTFVKQSAASDFSSYNYIGIVSNQTPSDTNLTFDDYTWTRIKGATSQPVIIYKSGEVTLTPISIPSNTLPSGWSTSPNGLEAPIYMSIGEWTGSEYRNWSEPVKITGQDGQKGDKGDDGIGINGADGKDAETYNISLIKGLAIVDLEDKLNVGISAQVVHIKGTSATTVTDNTYTIFAVADKPNITVQLNNNNGTYTYTNTNFLNADYHTSTNKTQYLTLMLKKGDTVLDKTVINVTFDAGATLTIKDNITSQVQNISGDTSSLKQTASALTTQVQNLSGDTSALKQTASSLTTQVTNLSGETSQIKQTANNIQLGLNNTGIDITNKKISLTADNVEFSDDVTVKGKLQTNKDGYTFTVDSKNRIVNIKAPNKFNVNNWSGTSDSTEFDYLTIGSWKKKTTVTGSGTSYSLATPTLEMNMPSSNPDVNYEASLDAYNGLKIGITDLYNYYGGDGLVINNGNVFLNTVVLKNYRDNNAAKNAGLVEGNVYHTNGVLKIVY